MWSHVCISQVPFHVMGTWQAFHLPYIAMLPTVSLYFSNDGRFRNTNEDSYGMKFEIGRVAFN